MPMVNGLWPTPDVTYAGSLARYHALRAVHTGNSDAYWEPTEIGFMDDWAAPSNMGGVAIGNTLVGAPSLAFDGDPTTKPRIALGERIILDHATAQNLVEFYIRGFSSDAGSFNTPNELVLEESNDGVNWTIVRTYTDTELWRPDETRYYSVADESLAGFEGLWRTVRVRATVISQPRFGLAECVFYANIGDVVSNTGTLWSAFLLSGGLNVLNDGNAFTDAEVDISTFRVGGGWYAINHGHVPIAQDAQIKMNARWTNAAQMPTEFVFEGRNWQGDWDHISSVGPVAGWSTFESRRYSI